MNNGDAKEKYTLWGRQNLPRIEKDTQKNECTELYWTAKAGTGYGRKWLKTRQKRPIETVPHGAWETWEWL